MPSILIYQILIILITLNIIIVTSFFFFLKKLVKPVDKEELEKEFKKVTEQEFKQAFKEWKEEWKEEQNQELQKHKADLENLHSQKELELKSKLDEQNSLVLEKERLQIKKELQQEQDLLRERTLQLQEKIENKEEILDEKVSILEQQKEQIVNYKQDLASKEKKLIEFEKTLLQKEKEGYQQIQTELVRVAKITPVEAKQELWTQVEEELGEEMIDWKSKYINKNREEAEVVAREIVSLAIQRCSSDVANELTISTVKLKSEDDKGKLIGKQGRNIQWLEKTLGVELIIDETPGVVTVSGFSSIRRNIAKKTIEKLIDDGRIHPASIEEMCEKAKGEIAQEIAIAGEETMSELGIYDFPPKLVRLVGRLKFRTSYGQNILKHSIEMAKLAGLLADELNNRFPGKLSIDKMICVKGALLHDIGKALDQEQTPKGDHVDIGEKVCDMFGLDWKIKKCISSHHTTGGDWQSYHDEKRGFCIEAVIVDTCDNISGARPGARKETMQAYFQRLEGIERIVNNIDYVNHSWVMQGGRQVRVFFDASKITPSQAYKATHKIARKINEVVRTPQEIVVIGFREDKIVSGRG